MNISITAIKIHIISNLGSFNIGKTILCKNEATSQYTTPTAALSSEQNSELQIAAPVQPQLSHSELESTETNEKNARTDS